MSEVQEKKKERRSHALHVQDVMFMMMKRDSEFRVIKTVKCEKIQILAFLL